VEKVSVDDDEFPLLRYTSSIENVSSSEKKSKIPTRIPSAVDLLKSSRSSSALSYDGLTSTQPLNSTKLWSRYVSREEDLELTKRRVKDF